jgi:hypothetical protein
MKAIIVLLYRNYYPLEISMSCSAFDNAFENNENINLYIHSEKIHKWDQEKCSEKFDELKKVII